MKTPFEILQIDENSADPVIKKAYLAGVKKYPPERFPSEFQKIRAAYEAIKTAEDRTAFKLFHKELPDKQELIEMMLEVLQDVVADSEAELNDEVTALTPLVGEEAAITSLSLVSFITGVELMIEENHDMELTLVSEEALSRSKSPFRTIDALADYVLTLVGVLSES